MGTENRIKNPSEYKAHTSQSCLQVSRYLVSYGVGAGDGAGDVIKSVGHGGILNNVAGVDDIRASGRDLNLDLIPHTSGVRQQAHPSEQLSDLLCWLAERDRQRRLRNKV